MIALLTLMIVVGDSTPSSRWQTAMDDGHRFRQAGEYAKAEASYRLATGVAAEMPDEPSFLGVLQAAAADAHASMVVVERRMQARDHPVLVTVPESFYLKCVVLHRQG